MLISGNKLLPTTPYNIHHFPLLHFKYTCDADDVKLAAIELSSFQKTLKIEKKNTIKVS